jgi:manganese oxidase
MKYFLLVLLPVILIFYTYIFNLSHNTDNFARLIKKERNTISCGPANSIKTNVGEIPYYRSWPGLTDEISVNDNRKSAGEMINGILYIKLETRSGEWYPETRDGEGLQVYAFAEVGKSMQLPGPLIRVTEGTIINAEIHHRIPGSPLVLHDFYSRPGNPNDSITIPYDSTYHIQFTAGKAGTYFYWATDNNLNFPINDLPFFNDSQLYGAFIVDPANTKPDPLERIMMIGLWNDTLNGPAHDGEELVINGLTWPYTERLTYENKQPVHWRVINASNQPHPMHLHGFYFTVKSHGNSDSDHIYPVKDRYLAVTELLKPHQTISLTWTPDREGNWLFHCHTLVHIMTGSFLRKMPLMSEDQMNDINSHARDGMGGLIMGITVLPAKKETKKAPDANNTERALTLLIEEKKNYYDTLTGYGFVLQEGNLSTDLPTSIPGPPIILERGKAVTIKIINHLREATSIHWHGLEIESYYDGVAGWGNMGKKLAPLIMPGDSFIAHMNPPRSGTFIYHTHMHNNQLFEGMYGPIIVTDSLVKYNPETNKIFLISQGGADVEQRLYFLNGKMNTDTLALKRGINYRFRVINITALGVLFHVSLTLNGVPVIWRKLANDGADLQAQQQGNKPAINQPVSIGQTMDFAFNPSVKGEYLFTVKNKMGKIVATELIRVQ